MCGAWILIIAISSRADAEIAGVDDEEIARPIQRYTPRIVEACSRCGSAITRKTIDPITRNSVDATVRCDPPDTMIVGVGDIQASVSAHRDPHWTIKEIGRAHV